MNLVLPQSACATKIAHLEITELKDYAQIVAVVEIVATQKTEIPFHQPHTVSKSKLIKHTALISEPIKGKKIGKEIDFLHMTGLITGKNYVVFLSPSKENTLSVVNNQYGAFKLSIVSLGEGITEAVRIPSSYVSLPKPIASEMGAMAKDESSFFVWVELKALTHYLQTQ